MDKQEFNLQLAEVVGTWTAAFAVVIGLIFGTFQYLEHKSAVRVQRTMDFVERYQGNSLLVEARLKLTSSINKRMDKINTVLKDDSLSSDQLGQLYSSEVMNMIHNDDLTGALEQVFTFYEQILLCKELKLCDDFIAESFFDIDGRSYVHTFYPYICHIRKEWSNEKQFKRLISFYIGDTTEICEVKIT